MGSKSVLTVIGLALFFALTLPLEGRVRELGDTFRNLEPLPTLSFHGGSVSTRELADTFNAGELLSPLVNLWIHLSLQNTNLLSHILCSTLYFTNYNLSCVFLSLSLSIYIYIIFIYSCTSYIKLWHAMFLLHASSDKSWI